MPKPPPALHTRITDAVADLAALLGKLEDEVPEKKRSPYGGFGTGKGGHGPLCSWNTPAAMLVLEIHEGIREIEQNLRYHTSGVLRERGDSPGNTSKCMAGIPALAAGAPHDVVMGACRKIESWCYRAGLVLGQIDPVSRLPRLPGEKDPKCPYCQTSGTLRVRHATGIVTCLRPGCRDSNGDRPRGKIEVGSYSHEPIIAWADGQTGVAA